MGPDAERGACVGDGAVEAVDHRRQRDAAAGVRLGVEEDLGVEDVVLSRLLQVGPGEVVEVLLADQHVHALIVEVEEALEVVEPVGRPHLLDRGVGEGDAVPFGQREHQLRLQRALDVEMQLGLGQAGDETWKVGHGTRRISSFVVRW